MDGNLKEDDFLNELEVFGNEVEVCMRFFYAYRSINDVLFDNTKALNIIKRNPHLWNTISRALEVSFFIALYRIFEKNDKKHNVNKLLQIAKSNIDIFSPKALLTIKIKNSPIAHERLDEFMRDIYVPTDKDFKRLERYVEKYRDISKTYCNYKTQFIWSPTTIGY